MSTKRKSRTKKWLPVGIIMIVIAGIVAVWFMRPVTSPYESVAAKIGDITTYYSFSGNVVSKNRQNVMSEQILQVSEINVNVGDVVNVGDTVIKTKAGDAIKAKIAGEVSMINVEEDAQVMGGIKLMEIVDFDNLEINVRVDEYDVAFLEEGKEATVRIGAINKEIKGNISSVSREGQVMNGVTFFTATIELEQDDSVRIGMSAEVTIIRAQVAEVVTLPMSVIQFEDNNEPYILKNDENGIAVKTEITTGINDGSIVEIKSGVADGDTVLYKKAAATPGMGFPGGRDDENGVGGGN